MMDAALPATSASSHMDWAYEDSVQGSLTRMKDELLAPHCHHCGKLSTPEKKLLVCAGCLCVYYCDQVCKNHDCERHDKEECRGFARRGVKENVAISIHEITWRGGSIDERLFQASTIGRIGAVRALIAEGGDVNWVGANGLTALHYSAMNGHLEVMKLLIASGARLDAPTNDEYGVTALHMAARTGYLLIVSALVEAGADIHIKEKKGRTALDIARDDGYPDIVELLTNKAEEQRVVTARAEAEAEAEAEAIRAQALAELLADDDREKAAGGSKDKDKGKSNSKDKGKNKNKNKDSK